MLPGIVVLAVAKIAAGNNSSDATDYTPPCPPMGTHSDVFRVCALNVPALHPVSRDTQAIFEAMKGHVLTFGDLLGHFGGRSQAALQNLTIAPELFAYDQFQAGPDIGYRANFNIDKTQGQSDFANRVPGNVCRCFRSFLRPRNPHRRIAGEFLAQPGQQARDNPAGHSPGRP
jgi:hypothetical protein